MSSKNLKFLQLLPIIKRSICSRKYTVKKLKNLSPCPLRLIRLVEVVQFISSSWQSSPCYSVSALTAGGINPSLTAAEESADTLKSMKPLIDDVDHMNTEYVYIVLVEKPGS